MITLSDAALRVRLWRAAEVRMHATTPRTRDRAGQVCLEAIAELRRRRAPLTRAPGGSLRGEPLQALTPPTRGTLLRA